MQEASLPSGGSPDVRMAAFLRQRTNLPGYG